MARGIELPGAEWIRDGIEDLERGIDTASALLLLVGAPRLRRLGFVVPASVARACGGTPPEHRLYEWLEDRYGRDAHSRYNALIRRLVSFERAVEALGGVPDLSPRRADGASSVVCVPHRDPGHR
ncbi:MAG: hypothetical protein HYV63_19395 [Candidatus Schekmanbacteria bacterium]|nr:hypothetical protein [Candidatus Schekmanbacteria bacterium]